MHLGLVCPDLTGHLNPMSTLGRALCRQGHEVSLVGPPHARPQADSAGLDLIEVGRKEHAAGELEAARAKLGRLQGVAAVRFTGQMLRQAAAIVLRDGPAAFAVSGIDGVIVDQVSPAGNSLAESLDLPFCVVCNALALNMEPGIPPAVTSWPYQPGWIARVRNRIGNKLFTLAAQPVFSEVNSFRVRHGLTKLRPADQVHGELIQVAQQPAFFDFPREQLPDHFHYTGPWHEASRDDAVSFPWNELDGRPVLYASLGTLQNRLRSLFAAIAAACAQLDVQLVMSLGRQDAELTCALPRGAILVPYAPQLQVLQRSSVVVTHAGLNTALEALTVGLPMVAIPLANDQPGVARRLASLGCAISIPPQGATAERLRKAIARVMDNERYRNASRHWQQELRSSPDVDDAAVLIGHALRGRRHITRTEAAGLSRT